MRVIPQRKALPTISRFRTDIQGLRAIAVAGVLGFHAKVPFISGGWVGVDVFFVVSGFLITELMLREADNNGGRLNIVEFYARRARRILPAAAVVAIVTLLGAALLRNGLDRVDAAGDALSSTLFYANTHLAAQNGFFDTHRSLFGQYWSLSVEEQFYAVWPLLLLGLSVAAGRYRRSALAICVIALSGGSFVQGAVWSSHNDGFSLDPARAFMLLPARAWELGLGALLAITSIQLSRIGRRSRRVLLVSGVAAIGFVITQSGPPGHFPNRGALLATFGTAAVITSGIGVAAGGIIDRLLANWIVQATGRYSYSLYLWHWPLLLLFVGRRGYSWPLGTAAMLALSVPAAVLTYHLVENPVRRAAPLRRSPARSLMIGATIIAVSVAASTAVNASGRRTLRTDTTAAAAVIDPISPAVTLTNAVPRNLKPALADARSWRYTPGRSGCSGSCTFGNTESSSSIALFGDSHAEHLVPGLARAVRTLDISLAEHVRRGCTLFRPVKNAERAKGCERFKSATMSALLASPPDVIVISTVSTLDIVNADKNFLVNVTETMRRLTARSKVVAVSFTPIAQTDSRECLADHLHAAGGCNVRWPTELNARYAAAARAGGATFLDLRPVLCKDTTCPAIIGDELVRTDSQHLTPEFSETLGPWWAEQLKPML